MPFGNLGNPMEYFNIGQGIGQANAPSMAGPQSVMDMFKTQQENQMKLAQTAALFKGEKDWEYGTDPQKIHAQKDLDALSGDNGSTPSLGNSGASIPGSVVGPTSSGNPPKPSNNMLIEKSRKGFGGREYVNPQAEGSIEQTKDLMKTQLQSDQTFHQVGGAIENMVRSYKGANAQLGGSGVIPGMVGTAAAAFKQPNTGLIKGYQGVSRDSAIKVAQLLSGSNRGAQQIFSKVLENFPESSDNPEQIGSVLGDLYFTGYSLNKAAQNSGTTLDKMDPDQTVQAFQATVHNMTQDQRDAIYEAIQEKFAAIPSAKSMNVFGGATEPQMNPFAKMLTGAVGPQMSKNMGFNTQEQPDKRQVSREEALAELKKRGKV